jgi:RNA polymerase sigma-B factor
VTTLALQQDRARLAQSYTNLARSLARRFSHRGERVEDLEQVALLALIKAADRFEPERERPFAAYAASCIVGELKRHFRDKLWAVRVPRSLQELYLAMKSARDELTQTLQASPTLAQISEFLGVPEEDLLLAMDASTNCWGASLDEPTTADGEGRGAELGDRDSRLERTLDRQVLRQSVEDLAPTERLLLKLVFFEQRTQREVAQEFGVSQMQISRLMHKTLGKMRTTFQPA